MAQIVFTYSEKKAFLPQG